LNNTVCCIGTGPSLKPEQIEVARRKGYRLFGCNLVYQVVPDLEVLYGCNYDWWETYWKPDPNNPEVAGAPPVKDHLSQKWTTNVEAANEFRINWIAEKFGFGLCEDKHVIHHGHGSGYSLVSLAHKLGATRVLLLGYDLKYDKNYNGKSHQIGNSPRHYFGEYPKHLQHWPSVRVKNGEHVELVHLYRTIKTQGLIEIINCSPDSALKGVIPSMKIEDT
jgi:hypothetical protein